MFSIIPNNSEELKESRANRDRYCYNQGKSDATGELPRDPSVYYKDSRDKDCYNMGFSYGESELSKDNGYSYGETL